MTDEQARPSVDSRKEQLRQAFLIEEDHHPSSHSGNIWGKAAERLRRLDSYRRAATVMSSLSPALKQMQLNALYDRKQLILPSPGLEHGFFLFDPARIPPQRGALTVQPQQRNPHAKRLPFDKSLEPRIGLLVTDAVAVGRDGSRLGDGRGHMDLQVAILSALGWLDPEAEVVAVVHEDRIVASLPMEESDVTVHWIVTPQNAIRTTAHEEKRSRRIFWEKLTRKQVRRNAALFFLEQCEGAHVLNAAPVISRKKNLDL